jgi:hypothetical protein
MTISGEFRQLFEDWQRIFPELKERFHPMKKDKCVTRKEKEDRILLLLIYSDDEDKIDLKELLFGMFGTVKYEKIN